jgi:tRNA-specific 2-thiouridylase
VDNEKGLYKSELTVSQFSWSAKVPDHSPFNASGRIRYRHTESPAQITILEDGKIHVRFLSPQRAITPGQILALYQDDTVLGGGIIQEVLS